MSFQALLNEIDKGLPSYVYLFYASDPFIHREALAAIKKMVPDTERDFNLHVFDLLLQGDEKPAFEKIIELTNTASFFGGRRFTIAEGNFQKLLKKDIERLNVYLTNPSENSVLVLLHKGTLTKDTREKFKSLKPVSLDVRESEIPSWIKQRAGLKKIEMSEEAANYLLGLIGPDLGLLSAEIEKFSLIGKQKIGMDDISDIVTGIRLYSIFDLVNALREKDTEKVFRIYKTLRETAEDYSLIGALNWQYGRNLHSKISPAEEEYLLRVFELLGRVDIDIKSSGRTFPMDYLLIKLLRLQEARSLSL